MNQYENKTLISAGDDLMSDGLYGFQDNKSLVKSDVIGLSKGYPDGTRK